MSWQRKRNAELAYVWRVEKQNDDRGNELKVAVKSTEPVKVWQIPDRSAKAEVPGQQHINVIKLGCKVLEGVDLWSLVEFRGKQWDVVAPPAFHHGTRTTRHMVLTLRERP